MEVILVFIVASVLGIVCGMVPGISVFVTLIVLYPFLSGLEPVNVITAYVVIVSMSQFFGSVSSTVFSIPGSVTSIISIQEGHTLFKQGQGDKAIMFAAIGSFIGSVAALVLSLVFLYSLFLLYGALDTHIKAALLVVTVAIFVITGKNTILVNSVMIVAGYVLGEVGYHSGTDTSFLTFGYDFLYSGLPTICIMLGLYVIPFIISSMLSDTKIQPFKKISFAGYTESIREIAFHRWVIVRGSIIGYLSGFIPGMTYHLGSIMSYYTEKYILERKTKYKVGSIECLLGAETANNAGVFSQLLPLLLIGIPITASQALIYDLFITSGASLSTDFFQSMLIQVTIAYLISSVIGLFVAGKYVNWITIVTAIDFKYIYAAVLVILVSVTLFVGYTIYQPIFYICLLFILIPFGMLIRKLDCMPLIFTFLMHDQIYSNFLTLYHLSI